MPLIAADFNGFQTHFLCLKSVGPWLHFTVAISFLFCLWTTGTGQERPSLPAQQSHRMIRWGFQPCFQDINGIFPYYRHLATLCFRLHLSLILQIPRGCWMVLSTLMQSLQFSGTWALWGSGKPTCFGSRGGEGFRFRHGRSGGWDASLWGHVLQCVSEALRSPKWHLPSLQLCLLHLTNF